MLKDLYFSQCKLQLWRGMKFFESPNFGHLRLFGF